MTRPDPITRLADREEARRDASQARVDAILAELSNDLAREEPMAAAIDAWFRDHEQSLAEKLARLRRPGLKRALRADQRRLLDGALVVASQLAALVDNADALRRRIAYVRAVTPVYLDSHRSFVADTRRMLEATGSGTLRSLELLWSDFTTRYEAIEALAATLTGLDDPDPLPPAPMIAAAVPDIPLRARSRTAR